MGSDSVALANGQEPTTMLASDGKEYTLAPLLMEQLGEVEQFAKKEHRAEVKELIADLGDLLSAEEKATWLQQLRQETVGTPSEEKLNDGAWTWMICVTSPKVVAFAVLLRLRKGHPELEEEEAKDLITAEAIAKMEGTMNELIGLDAYSSGIVGDDAKGGEEDQGEAPSG